MSRIMKRGNFKNRQQLQRCAESGTPRICFCSGFPRPHDGQYEASPLLATTILLSVIVRNALDMF